MTDASARPGSALPLLFVLTAYGQYIVGVRGLVSPFIGAEFGLDDTQITFLQGTLSLGALATFVLTYWADRRGRRRVLLTSFVALPLTCLATALAPGAVVYAGVQIVGAGFNGALLALLTVMVSEEASEDGRAKGQAWWGAVTALGASGFLILGPLLENVPGSWRWAFVLGGLPLLLFPVVRRRLPESRRFQHAERAGRIDATSSRDLFRGAYRRRAWGMIVATGLRPIAIIAILSWTYYHALENMGFSAGTGSLIMIAGGLPSLIGYPLGVRFTNSWGRRPTLIVFCAIGIAAGVAYYWVPADTALPAAFWMAFWFGISQTALHIFGVADRCIDTEAFPTALRGTYTGWTRVAMAVASIVAQFALSALTLVTEGLALAITVLCIVSFVPSVFFFLWGAPETKGLALEDASLELRGAGSD